MFKVLQAHLAVKVDGIMSDFSVPLATHLSF